VKKPVQSATERRTDRHAATGDREQLLRIVDSFPRLTATVLADLVADEFVFGEIARVSREAPVLILKHRDREILPGGGANAIYNLAALGVNVLPVGVVGDDEAGNTLLHCFRRQHIPITGIVKLKGYTTVTKTRILAGQAHTGRQQVVRVDREPEFAPNGSVLRRLVTEARGYVRISDALLISDYGYGSASPEVWDAVRANRRLNGIPVTLDSRYRIFDFAGVTAATPNEPEVEAALGLRIGQDQQRLLEAGRKMMRRMNMESLVITRGRDGMVAFTKASAPVHIPIHGSDQITDVTGAGDTVIATFTAAIAAGASTQQAARLATYAAGIVVMKRGTATASHAELKKVIAAH
jgi:rfaE bifunctional protein kinase chain/domain